MENDKNASVNRLKNKLDAQIVELENSLEMEKKLRLDMERNKRKVETDYRLARKRCFSSESTMKTL